MQSIHCRRVTAKVLFLNGLSVSIPTPYFCSPTTILPGWAKLFCNLYLLLFVGVKPLWGLTTI